MVASGEKALAILIGRYLDRIQGAGYQAVSHLANDRNADPVLQETTLPQQLLLRQIDGASLAEMAEHANHDTDLPGQIEAERSLCRKAFCRWMHKHSDLRTGIGHTLVHAG